MKKVLVLGAGLVARPLVQYLMDQPDIHVMVASRTVSKAAALVGTHAKGVSKALDVSDQAAVEQVIRDHDLTISLLPWTHHLTVAKLCLKHGKHLVTTSYVKPEMAALDADARAKGLNFMNEIGLDPGIDHMSAMKIIHTVRQNGGSVASFRSYCGGLPAREANTNPFLYKFSWSPKGVLLAAGNAARYMVDGREINIASENLFDDYHFLEIPEFGTFEAYPNRDSMPYVNTYGFRSIRTMYRGTIRNIGHCEVWREMVRLGLFDNQKVLSLAGKTARQYLATDILGTDNPDLQLVVKAKLQLRDASVLLRKMKWLGFFCDKPLVLKEGTAVDVLTELMFDKMQFSAGERDLVILHHDFIAEYPAGKKEHITSTLIDHGIPHGDSAMSRTVGLPAAIIADLIVKGIVNVPGVRIPVDEEVYNPVMAKLVDLGVHFKEVFTPLT